MHLRATKDLIFRHPDIANALTIQTGANNISWGYTLNMQAIPTYGGEVVQVLSTSIDDLQITGDVQSYAQMESIYRWFLDYMELATHEGDWNQHPVIMQYPHRHWTFKIRPLALPTMRYGRDVVVPSWTMQAHIVDPDIDAVELTLDRATNENFAEFISGRVSAGIGYRARNPFSDPLGILTKEENELFPQDKNSQLQVEGQESKKKTDNSTKGFLTGIAKQMNYMFDKYYTHDFDEATSNFAGLQLSQPSVLEYESDLSGEFSGGASNEDGGGEPGNYSKDAEGLYEAAKHISDQNRGYSQATTRVLDDITPSMPLDCSNSTALALSRAGMYKESTATNSTGFANSWGDPGKGKYFTVWANTEHVWIEFHGDQEYSRFDTSPHGDGGHGPRMRKTKRTDQGLFTARHWPGQ